MSISRETTPVNNANSNHLINLYPNSNSSSHKTNSLSHLENYTKRLESQSRSYIKQILELQLQLDIANQAIGQYILMQKEFEEMKEKFKYSKGKFLDNDRKENEILILRAENSNIKKQNEKNLKTIEELNAKIDKLESQLTISTSNNNNNNLNSSEINSYRKSSTININKTINNNNIINIIKNKRNYKNERSNSVNSIFDYQKSDIIFFNKHLPGSIKNSNNNNLTSNLDGINMDYMGGKKKIRFDFNNSKLRFGGVNQNNSNNMNVFKYNNHFNKTKNKFSNNVQFNYYNSLKDNEKLDKFNYHNISHNLLNVNNTSKDKNLSKLNPKLILYKHKNIYEFDSVREDGDEGNAK